MCDAYEIRAQLSSPPDLSLEGEARRRFLQYTLAGAAANADVIILAQASMAGAAELVSDLGVPVLSSPPLGVEAAISAYRSA